MEYKLKNGKVIHDYILRRYEGEGRSEAEIADIYDISRMGLYKVRVRMGCRDGGRSDIGMLRDGRTIEEKRERINAYHRDYYYRNKSKYYRPDEKVDGRRLRWEDRRDNFIDLAKNLDKG